jgi:ketosteroid isomerase-like protein
MSRQFSYNIGDEVAVNQDKLNSSDPEKNEPMEGSAENNAIDEFLQKLPGTFRWPKPDAAAVAAAEEAILRVASTSSAGIIPDEEVDEAESSCSACGGLLPAAACFCVWCGVATKNRKADASAQAKGTAGGEHHIHHHYHHLVPAEAGKPSAPAPATADDGTPPPRVGTASSPGGRAEASARQISKDWVQACNTKHIDDLLELYATDATLIRSSVPPVRSLPAIRAFLVSLLEAGLGDVEMESMRLELLGDVAIDIGRCKMLVPVAMGKRREERGKYLIVLVRQPAGGWKILADSWSADLAVNVSDTARKAS